MKPIYTIFFALLPAVFIPLSAYGIEVKVKGTANPPTADSTGTVPPGGIAPTPQEIGTQAESASVPQKTTKSTADESRERSSKNSLLERLKRTVREAQKKEAQPQYDRLIDDNNDGVDDRIEKPPAAKAAGKKPAAERKPRTDSTRKAPPK